MGKMLLGIAAGLAAATFASGATAGTPEEPFVGIPNVNATAGTLGGSQPGFVVGPGGVFVQPGTGDHRFRRFGNGSGGGVWVNGGQWAQYNNEAFKSDSYNDWWHDRPDRAYPAWMRNNEGCARQWFQGNTLRC